MTRPSAINTILLACLIAGTLDISYAIITWGPIFGKVTATRLLQGIASTVLGKSALTGGMATALVGLLMHYCISLAWCTVYFLIFPYVPALARNKWVSGMAYGIFVWLMMTILIVPLVTGKAYHFDTIPFLKSIAPMVLLLGPAIAIIINRYYFTVTITSPQPG
jgi:uncharacterized membrane protein YagU involved in acid resistance